MRICIPLILLSRKKAECWHPIEKRLKTILAAGIFSYMMWLHLNIGNCSSLVIKYKHNHMQICLHSLQHALHYRKKKEKNQDPKQDSSQNIIGLFNLMKFHEELLARLPPHLMLINHDLSNKDNSYSQILELIFIAFCEIQRFWEAHLP